MLAFDAVGIFVDLSVTAAQSRRECFTGDRQLEPAIRARKTPLGFSSAQIAPLVLEMSRQTAKRGGSQQ
jgi:hypothetical protein